MTWIQLHTELWGNKQQQKCWRSPFSKKEICKGDNKVDLTETWNKLDSLKQRRLGQTGILDPWS